MQAGHGVAVSLPFSGEAQWRWRWMLSLRAGARLHRIVEHECTSYDYGACVPWGRTACGLDGVFRMPGMFERMGAARCLRCCRALGIPAGVGAPFNDDSLPPEVSNA